MALTKTRFDIHSGRAMFAIQGFTEVAVSTLGGVEEIDLGIGGKFNIRSISILSLGCLDFDMAIGMANLLDFSPSGGAWSSLYEITEASQQLITTKVGSDNDGLIFKNMDGLSGASDKAEETDYLYFRFNNDDASNKILSASTAVTLVVDY